MAVTLKEIKEISVPLLGFVAPSGSGKTTLLENLIPLLKQANLNVGVVKHTHHDFEIDQPRKDSYRLRRSGAEQTMLASRHRCVLIRERMKETEIALTEALAHFDTTTLDIILVEGFKHAAIPKIEIHRPALGKPPLFVEDEQIIAVAADDTLVVTTELPILSLNNPESVATFILERVLK